MVKINSKKVIQNGLLYFYFLFLEVNIYIFTDKVNSYGEIQINRMNCMTKSA